MKLEVEFADKQPENWDERSKVLEDRLCISHCGITKLNLNFDLITKLDVQCNNLTEWTSKLPINLKYFNFSYNFIKEWNTLLPDKIEWIQCEQCKLERWTAKLPNSLKRLYIQRNKLTEWTVELHPNLNSFGIEYNKLTRWDKKLPKTLLYFNIEYNNLTEWTIDIPDNVYYFHACGNKIKYITESCFGYFKYFDFDNVDWISMNVTKTLSNRNKDEIKTNNTNESVTYYVPSLLALCCDIVEPPSYVNIKKTKCGDFNKYAVKKKNSNSLKELDIEF